MKKALIGFVAVGLVACGGAKQVETVGISTKEDAVRFTQKNQAALQSMQSDGKAARSLQDLSVTQNYSCATSGTVSVSTNVGDLSNIGATATSAVATIDFAAHDCKKANDYLIDGTIAMGFGVNTQDSANLSYTLSMNGSVASTLYKDDGSIDQQATVTYNNLKWVVTVRTTAASTCVSATATGSFTIGGTTYQLTDAELAGFWGSASGTGSSTVCTN